MGRRELFIAKISPFKFTLRHVIFFLLQRLHPHQIMVRRIVSRFRAFSNLLTARRNKRKNKNHKQNSHTAFHTYLLRFVVKVFNSISIVSSYYLPLTAIYVKVKFTFALKVSIKRQKHRLSGQLNW